MHIKYIKIIINNMGNSNGKQTTYEQYYESMNNASSTELDLTSLDPYNVLNIPKDFTWEQLKDAYKTAAMKTHPDKPGGNKLAFDFVTTCFKTLATEYKNKNSKKSHYDLKKESTEYFERMVNTNSPHPSESMPETNVPFDQRFNKAFDDCKYHDDEIEYGYGGIMADSNGKREEISIENVFNKGKVDNSTFNEVFNKSVPVSKEIVKYKEPEPLPMAKSLAFTEIGSKRPDDYSSGVEKNTLAYTDYMVAYNGMRLANPEDINKKKLFKSVEEYQKYSEAKTTRSLSEKERKYIDKKKLLEEKQEFERQERIKMQNIAIQKAHEKANRLLIR